MTNELRAAAAALPPALVHFVEQIAAETAAAFRRRDWLTVMVLGIVSIFTVQLAILALRCARAGCPLRASPHLRKRPARRAAAVPPAIGAPYWRTLPTARRRNRRPIRASLPPSALMPTLLRRPAPHSAYPESRWLVARLALSRPQVDILRHSRRPAYVRPDRCFLATILLHPTCTPPPAPRMCAPSL